MLRTFVCYRVKEEKTVEGLTRKSLFLFSICMAELRRKQSDDAMYSFRKQYVMWQYICVCARVGIWIIVNS